MTHDNDRAKIGDNNPPSEFDEIRLQIEEAVEIADSIVTGKPVESEEQSDAIGAHIKLLRNLRTQARAMEKEELEPFNSGKDEVKSRYNPLIQPKKGKMDLALDALKNFLTPYKLRQDEVKQAKAAQMRKEFEEKRTQVVENVRASRSDDSLETKIKTEEDLKELDKMEAQVKKAEKDKAQVKTGGTSLGIRKTYTPEIENLALATRYYWDKYPDDFKEMIFGRVKSDVARGVRDIPGVKIVEGGSLA